MASPMSALALSWPRIDADPIAAGLLVGAMTILAAIYFARHVWPGGRGRRS